MPISVKYTNHFNLKFPNASNTGTSGTLTDYTGSTTFSTANATIQDKNIVNDGISVTANNVTFQNCKIVYNGPFDTGVAMVFLAVGVTGTRFINCEIDCADAVERAIKGFDDVYVEKCNIHDSGNGVEVASSVTVIDSYLWNIFTPDGATWHADGVQTGEGAVSNTTIQHNTILLPGGETGAINVIDNSATFTYNNILIDNNLLAGGSYTFYFGAGTMTNCRATNNHFSTRYATRVGQFQAWYPNFLGDFTATGNVIDETGVSANDNSW